MSRDLQRIFPASLLVLILLSPLAAHSQTTQQLTESSWTILKGGFQTDKSDDRAKTVRVLSLMTDEPQAEQWAAAALHDDKPEVRAAAAMSLGQLHVVSAIPELKKALNDKQVSVVLAAAHALLLLHDPSAYDVYYAILMGDRKSSEGLIQSQLDMLKDPKQMAVMGVEQGLGFVPFASMGYTALKMIFKDDTSPVRAAAAKVLADDPDSISEDALIQVAITDKHELVRTAALEALAHRGDPTILPRLSLTLIDDKSSVRYTAAALILHLARLQSLQEKRKLHGAHGF